MDRDASRTVRGRALPTLALLTALVTVVLLGACSTAPMTSEGSSSTVTSAPLRDGPRTATLPGADVEPVTDDPVSTLPVTVNSAGHPPVRVTDTSRIIAVDRNGTLGNIVFSLGLGSRVVGRDTSTAFPAAAHLPRVTESGHSLNAESVLALHPSVVLVDEATTPSAAVDQIRGAGIPVVAFTSTRTLATNSALIRAVAASLGVTAAGEQLVTRTDAQMAAARKLVPRPSGDPTIAFLYIRGRLQLMAGPHSGVDDLTSALGGQDAGTRAGLSAAFTAITTESLIKANPDVILVMTQGAESVGGLDGVLRLPGVAQTTAGKARRVIGMDQTEVLSFGPDVGKVMGALARAIYT